ncbi:MULTISPECIES: undecaprenyl-diphosphate phosphatase [unclassified Paenibacillus]|uniref:undecaprenyl-diphosphate phosphatase n=1 Tax=unclassified Paenibacillus TaxID=185978 RepID=UPI002404D839|nr:MULTISPECIES: undecaprenyl-diphosphate phosphatase [unclassified Paenibacillus]MDF9840555.1 undecaprenyl-diphosphatase [Paenibacillus sp. PastF-2]MDF9847137.1 undecaprenyl-diphosphatase [Paenibacillus sp. PastM-2]MDF9853709.1 undecaprenyl-diphosphatase [Paenibacillus sp. PastF-1]MDH6478805.1 undecaprenyl-diphosphatase [Paenibacillus sp. PastH-2]MDH6506537.1 undecaprenyl-diphosphatase [Paenibacillus sp. PastM-3]
MELLTIMKAIILGIVEGLTEFAPVSSTGHMIIVDDMWLKSQEFLGKYTANTFKVVIQLGSILAVVIIFYKRFIDLLGLKRFSRKEMTAVPDGVPQVETEGRLKLGQVLVGLIPAGVFGLLFEDYIDEHLFSTSTVLIGLVVGALFMIIADRFAPKKPKTETVDQITYRQALSVGLIQCVSLWPGFSRSGSTISGGVLLGMSHRAAADFTFIMAVPIMAGASLISLIKNWQYFTLDALPFFIAGFISAFLFALLSMRFFLKLINRIKLLPFAIYRIVLAAVVYLIWF